MFRNLFHPDSGLMITMAQLTDAIFLSLFWILGCVPIVTIGASCAALYDASFRGFRQGEKHSWQRFWGRGILFPLIVCAMALPKQVILIPLLREMSALKLYDTIWAVIFPIVGWPFGVFLRKQFPEGIPSEMVEAFHKLVELGFDKQLAK